MTSSCVVNALGESAAFILGGAALLLLILGCYLGVRLAYRRLSRRLFGDSDAVAVEPAATPPHPEPVPPAPPEVPKAPSVEWAELDV